MKQKIFFITVLLIVFLIDSVLAVNEIEISVNIKPHGAISNDYNVVGDLFTYNVTLYNNSSKVFNDTLTIEIIAPGNRSIAFGDEISYIFSESGVNIIRSPLQHIISIKEGEYETLIPYINLSINKDTKIWPFDMAGDYSMKICSSDFNTKFIRIYDSPTSKNYYYYYHCIDYYFSAMPEWQYKLFTKEKDAAEKVQEANQKLLDLNIDLENATQSMKIATWIMLGVAILTLIIAYKSYKFKR